MTDQQARTFQSSHRAQMAGRYAATPAQRRSLSWLAGDVERNPAYSSFRWFFTNPFCNLCSVVIGISHLPRTVYVARGDGHTYTDGWNWGYSVADGTTKKLWFISHRGRFVEWSAGWKTSGAFGGAFRIARAKNIPPEPGGLFK